MTTTPAEMSDIGRRAVRTIIADALAAGTDLTDPAAREAFCDGLHVGLAWLTAAHATGKLDDDAFAVIENTLSAAIKAAEQAPGV